MKNLCVSLALAVSAFSAAGNAQETASVKKSYSLVVWADVSFDENSQLTQVEFPEKATLPAPFVNYLTTSVPTGKFMKPEIADANKQLESGLKIVVEIDPATSKAKILSQDLMPRPTRAEQQSEPLIRVKGEWSGRVLVTCSIS